MNRVVFRGPAEEVGVDLLEGDSFALIVEVEGVRVEAMLTGPEFHAHYLAAQTLLGQPRHAEAGE